MLSSVLISDDVVFCFCLQDMLRRGAFTSPIKSAAGSTSAAGAFVRAGHVVLSDEFGGARWELRMFRPRYCSNSEGEKDKHCHKRDLVKECNSVHRVRQRHAPFSRTPFRYGIGTHLGFFS